MITSEIKEENDVNLITIYKIETDTLSENERGNFNIFVN